MFTLLVLLQISLSLYKCVALIMTPELICENVSGGNETLRLSVTMDINVKHAVFECDGQQLVYIEGAANAPTFPPVKDNVIQKPSTFPPVKDDVTQKPPTFPPVKDHVIQKPSTFPPVKDDVTQKPSTFSPRTKPLKFHQRCGDNIAIMEGGRVAEKYNNAEYINSQVFTKRPLRDNELFEVRLKKTSQDSSFGIGVVTESPNNIHIFDDMRKSSKAFMLFHNDVFTNGKKILSDYGRDLYKLQEGGTAGVKRTANGTLHFFMNGVDLGQAVTGIPSPVYGIVDLWRAAYRVSIVQ